MYFLVIFLVPLALLLLAVVIGSTLEDDGPRHHRLCACGKCERKRIDRNLKRWV